MKFPTLKETFQQLGLTEDVIDETFPELAEDSDNRDEGEVDPSTGNTEGLGEIGYLSSADDDDDEPEMEEGADDGDSDGEDDDDGDSDGEVDDGEEFDEVDLSDAELDETIDSLTDEDLDEIAVDANLDEGFIRLASVTKRKARRKKMKKWLKTSKGRSYLTKKVRTDKTAVAKKKRKKHEKKLKARGGPKRGKMFREDILEDIAELSNAMDFDPVEQFESFSVAFNGLADLGELAAGSVLDEDEEAARAFAGVSVGAEGVLREMEKFGGSVTLQNRRMLESTLAEAMDEIGELLATHDVLEGIDSRFVENAKEIAESGDVDNELSMWDSSPLVEDSVLEDIRKLTGN